MTIPSSPDDNQHRLWRLAPLLVVAFALVLRAYYINTASVDHPIRGDATQYYAYALNLLKHGTFSMDSIEAASPVPDSYRDPGYPFFLYVLMTVFGTAKVWYGAVLLLQSLLGALTAGLATRLGQYWLPLPWAVGAGILMAAWPHSITINGYILSETLFGFLCAAALLLCAQACRRPSAQRGFGAGLIFGAASLTNAILLPFGILCALFMHWKKIAPRNVCIAIAAAAMLLPCAWAIRNIQIPVGATTSSANDRALQNLVQGAWPDYHAAWKASLGGDEDGKKKLKSIDEEYQGLRTDLPMGARAIFHRLAEHPLRSAAWYVIEKPFLLWGWDIRIGEGDVYVFPTNSSPFQTNPLMRTWESLCRGLNLPLGLLAFGSFWLIRSRAGSRNPAALVMLLLGYVTLLYSVLQAEPRYSIAFRSFEILLGTSAAYWATTLSRNALS
jgi:hypothetical protein